MNTLTLVVQADANECNENIQPVLSTDLLAQKYNFKYIAGHALQQT